ncbi:MAG TPA: hypothetical protein VGZ73_27155 [Bryobacteraceae bacterium]|jgi:hypothetical protein|nr:hypothetical protein [Bryobacteraceae bacterium]
MDFRLLVVDRPPHRDSIPIAFAPVLQVPHDLPHKMNSEPTIAPLFQPGFEIGRGSAQRVEGPAAIGIFNVDDAIVKSQSNVHGILHSCAAPMPHRIGEQLFDREVQVEFHVIAERMFTAESSYFGCQAPEFSHAPVEDNFRVGQNCLIVPYWRMRFQVLVARMSWRGHSPETTDLRR